MREDRWRTRVGWRLQGACGVEPDRRHGFNFVSNCRGRAVARSNRCRSSNQTSRLDPAGHGCCMYISRNGLRETQNCWIFNQHVTSNIRRWSKTRLDNGSGTDRSLGILKPASAVLPQGIS